MRLFHHLRQRFTWRLLGLLLLLLVGLQWAQKLDIQIGDKTFDAEAVTYVLGIVAYVLSYVIPPIKFLADKPILGTSTPQEVKVDPFTNNRKSLLEAVDQIWLSGLLDHLLNQQESLRIDLRFLEPEKTAQMVGGKSYQLSDNRAVLQAFNDFGRRMVLLGEPGAGKTVLLLQLTQALWQEAQDDDKKRLPLVLPLSSWAAKQPPFQEWLETELRERYGAPPKVAAVMVNSERFIYMLDGLDEVAAECRAECLSRLKAFIEDPNRHIEYVLCSRRAEFAALDTQLDVPGEIVLQPLQLSRVREYLLDDAFIALRTLIDENKILREDFARIPFMVNTMAYVTRGKSIEAMRLLMNGKENEESLRAVFLDTYITQRLDEQTNDRYPKEQTRRWLRWLAGQLINHQLTDFYLESIQLDWIATQSDKKKAVRVVGLTSVLIMSLAFALIFGLVVGTIFFLVVVLAYWIVDKNGVGLFKEFHISIHDKLYISFSRSRIVATILTFQIVYGVFFGLAIASRTNLVIGIMFGLLFAPFLGLSELLAKGLKSETIPRFRSVPNEGIQRSLLNGIIAAIVNGLAMICFFFTYIVLFSSNFIFQYKALMLTGILLGFLFGFRYGLGTYIQHYSIRTMIALAGCTPKWRYDHFLDYASERVILRKVGGGYRFVHDYLRQHMARQA